MRNIEHLVGNLRFTFLFHDVIVPLSLEVDEIYNLACHASPSHYQRNPIQTTKTSVQGAIKLLDLARRLNCRVLQASTSEVYGDPCAHPQPEEYWGHVNPIGPRSCYDEGKRCADTRKQTFVQRRLVAVLTQGESGLMRYGLLLDERTPTQPGSLIAFIELRAAKLEGQMVPE